MHTCRCEIVDFITRDKIADFITKDQLIKFLQDNLTIELSKGLGMYDDPPTIDVEINLGGETISTSSVSL